MTLPATFTPELLNRLFRESLAVDDLARSSWLAGELGKMGLAQCQSELEGEFAAVLGSSYVFLDGYPGGAKDSPALWAENDAAIRATCPWLDGKNFAWAVEKSRYYAWHDGLVSR